MHKISVAVLYMARLQRRLELWKYLSSKTIAFICICLGALDHIVVTTPDGKFPLNQLGQVSMKSPLLMMVNMSSFPEVRPQHTHTHTVGHGQSPSTCSCVFHADKHAVTKSVVEIKHGPIDGLHRRKSEPDQTS